MYTISFYNSQLFDTHVPSSFLNANLQRFRSYFLFLVDLFLLKLIHLFELFKTHIRMLEYFFSQIIYKIFHNSFTSSTVRTDNDQLSQIDEISRFLNTFFQFFKSTFVPVFQVIGDFVCLKELGVI